MVKMPRAVIADSDEDDDEDSFFLPPSPGPQPRVAPIIDLTASASSQDVLGKTSGATSSTDPAFFQSVLDEQRAAVRNQTSRGSGATAHRDNNAPFPRASEGADETAKLSSTEILAPGTLPEVVTGLASIAQSSATNPATQRSYPSTMARMKSTAPRHDMWDVPSSTEVTEAGTELAAAYRPLNNVFSTRDTSESHGDEGRRKRRRLAAGTTPESASMVGMSLRIETTESQLRKAHRESLPSTLSVPGHPSLTMGQRKLSTASHESDDEGGIDFGGTGDTNAFSTGEKQLRIEVAEEMPHGILRSSRDALGLGATDEEDVFPQGDQAMDEPSDASVGAEDAAAVVNTRSSRRRRSSSPDVISNIPRVKARSKKAKAKQPKQPTVIYSDSEEEGNITRIVDHNITPEKGSKRGSVKKRRTVLDDEDGGSASDPPVQEVYAEEDFDTDFVDAPKKQAKKQPKKRGRPKKNDKIQDEKAGAEKAAPKKRKTRGRPRKSDTVNLPSEDEEQEPAAPAVDAADETHDITKHEDHEQEEGDEKRKDNSDGKAESEAGQDVGGQQDADEKHDEIERSEIKPVFSGVQSGDQVETLLGKPKQEAADTKIAAPETSRPSSLAAAIAATSKPIYRVGLSKRSRIAPLLKSLRKPSDEPPEVANKGGKGTRKKGTK